MQVYVEIILVAILVVILFNGSITGLKEFANSVLGKAVMVCLIIFISHQFGTNAGLLMAGITIILLQNNIEGFTGKEGIAPAKEGACKEGDENCTDALGNPLVRNAQPIAGSQSGRQDPDEAPGATTDSDKRQGKINGNGKRLAKKFVGGKKKQEQAEKGPAKPVDKKEDKKPVEDKKKEDKKEEDKKKEEEEESKKEKEGKKGFESFSNYTLDNAADYTNLGSTLAAYSTNDNIMTSMRASEYAKTAPGGCALMTNHIDTMRIVNNPGSQGIL